MNRTRTLDVSIQAVSPEFKPSWAQATRGSATANAPASPAKTAFDLKVMRILLLQTGAETRHPVDAALHLRRAGTQRPFRGGSGAAPGL